MFLILTLGALSFLLTLVLTPLIRDHVGHLGFLDHPDGIRKRHASAVPTVGGIAIAVSYVITFAIALGLPFTYTYVLRGAFTDILKLTGVAAVVFVTGVLDDLLALKAWQKLVGITLASVLAYLAGIRVDIHLFPMISSLTWLSFPITVAWLVGCANAFNLIDGMDGLAAGIGLFATLTMLLAALSQGNLPLVMATMPLAGCLLAFLLYNFNPASVFLGDSGSLLIGFLLGCYGALWSEKAVTLVALTVPVLAVAVPLLDVGLSIVRRFLRDKPIFQGDRGHIHHKLLDLGFSHKKSVLMIYSLCGLAAVVSLVVLAARHYQFSGLLVVGFCIVAWIGIQYLGYWEFTVAGEMFFKGKFRRIIDVETRLRNLENELAAAGEVRDCWAIILNGSKEFGFHGVRMKLGDTVFEHSNRSKGTEVQIRIPLPESQYINFYQVFSVETNPLILNAFVGAIERGMKRTLEKLQASLIPQVHEAALDYERAEQAIQSAGA